MIQRKKKKNLLCYHASLYSLQKETKISVSVTSTVATQEVLLMGFILKLIKFMEVSPKISVPARSIYLKD